MNWIPGNTKQGTFTIVVFILLLVCIQVGFYINDSAEYFSENLLPELTGMLFELCIILFIIDRWQEQNRIQLLIVKEKRLREYLIFFLRHGFKTLPRKYRVGAFYGEEHTQNIEYLDSLFEFIKENGLATQEIDAIKAQCDIELNTFGNLLPVASELTDDHFKAWSRIVFFMVRLSKNLGDDEESIKYIIINIKRYENASHDNGIYVGSKGV
ncbi:hypothetical protein [Vibrio hepatarius]|uniref:hypothetical protein n=1 Tax=Vibrio hepatarius TaxID=171383 RepID=UPI001C094ED2|nr:hypothetical protein [Vibrio hepatarius]MBU2896483.1 hypothetical protein [Vibrio hepatarius]